ncbi:glycosyltransferase family 4 protein [Marinifilum sp. D737]|uniref:glycosyltransferase family 4 protein n=1 Tax=Marinifilum sp. D737 TaxID=2969628 RepID=UPI0022758CED|nr:glycosyltransferase family 4 protein [Marinifilum sp. D737]MCY1635013.1 glycosyltransferase family 4 protein [Marinifilum sp. D737]
MIVKVLVLTPKFSVAGGVSEFNRMLFDYSKNDLVAFYLTSIGKSANAIQQIVYTIWDFVRFFFTLAFKKIDVVHVNPSLGKNAIRRDAIFIWIAKLFKKKVFVHWHGWNPDNEFLLDQYNKFLKRTLFKADHIKFLASSFQDKFIEKGFENVTSLGNTFIDNTLLTFKPKELNADDKIRILFLSTISKNKGIHKALDVFKLIKKDYPQTVLIIAGIGSELEALQKRVDKEQVQDVEFKGYVKGEEKGKCYSEADMYLFPSEYEGMPTSVIEAMGFGLPIVCNSVGALPDFFKNEKMGYILSSNKVEEYRLYLSKLIEKIPNTAISTYNSNFVSNNFLASVSVKKIDEEYEKLFC